MIYITMIASFLGVLDHQMQGRTRYYVELRWKFVFRVHLIATKWKLYNSENSITCSFLQLMLNEAQASRGICDTHCCHKLISSWGWHGISCFELRISSGWRKQAINENTCHHLLANALKMEFDLYLHESRSHQPYILYASKGHFMSYGKQKYADN